MGQKFGLSLVSLHNWTKTLNLKTNWIYKTFHDGKKKIQESGEIRIFQSRIFPVLVFASKLKNLFKEPLHLLIFEI